ncbi:MAG: formate dehydrogenase accessory protein FdhE [Acidobacteriia bacterium]|nr:formate dehydrogenase accessory protein FdhE [Terriglobia bacterium]
MIRSAWDRRIERAGELEQSCPPAAALMRFYGETARFQRQVTQGLAAAAQPVDERFLLRYLPPLFELVRREGTAPMAEAAVLAARSPDLWDALLRSHADPTDPGYALFGRVLMQPYMEWRASQSEIDTGTVRPTCPFCGENPVAAVLRQEGDGGKRTLLCSLCATEWEFRRMLCPSCGEEDRDKLPVYTAEQFAHVRVEACETCRVYLKAVDLTINGLAVPVVDEMASVALDLWAEEKGYSKLQPNLFQM